MAEQTDTMPASDREGAPRVALVESSMISEHFKFSSDLLSRLGEELMPNVDQGIVELVRNAYDADAVNCTVELIDTQDIGGTLRVRDDGIGMTAEGIRSGWLVLGRSKKTVRGLTSLGRLPVGEKGLGRLAALRLGREAQLTTRPKSEPGQEYRLNIDWSAFDSVDIVESVNLEIRNMSTTEGCGTSIEVERLYSRIGRRETQRLARALLLLADPFEHQIAFHPRLIAAAFSDLEKRVQESYFEEAQFHLIANLDSAGHPEARVLDWKGEELWVASHAEFGKRSYNSVEAVFDLWVFVLDSEAFSSRPVSLGEVKEWLSVVGGVHLYHRGLRVHPYGDPGHDWLDMNLARVRNPELRPATNTSIGRVVALDPEEILKQKTDRSGFIENDAFLEMRRFAQDATEWMAKERLRAREARRRTERVVTSTRITDAREGIEKVIKSMSPRARSKFREAVGRLQRAHERETRTLRDEVQLYRTLGTVGTTAAVFAHESAKPVSQILKMVGTIQRRGSELLGEKYPEFFEKPIGLIRQAAEALRSFAALPLTLLLRDKRRTGRVNVNSVIKDVYSLFEPFLVDAKIRTKLELSGETAVIIGSVAALESIVANLLTNSINAFNSESAQPGSREIVIRTESSGKKFILRVLDNGPGINGLKLDDIWLPGRTTMPGGTGLGLTIVRDSVLDLGGSIYALEHGELGGAEFTAELPVVGESRRT